jgi:hypothetical protein
MVATINLSVPDELYEQRLRALAAWWCLGSSALEPQLLVQFAPVPPSELRSVGL